MAKKKPNCTAVLQLKRNGNKVLLQGRGMEDAIAVAITAMNEPKTCSITTLRRYLVDSKKYRTENHICERPSADHVATHPPPRLACPPSLCSCSSHSFPFFSREMTRDLEVFLELFDSQVTFLAGRRSRHIAPPSHRPCTKMSKPKCRDSKMLILPPQSV